MPEIHAPNEPVADLASRLETMTDDEVFDTMSRLEALSETSKAHERDDILSRIALVESEVERRFPGQILAPYREWKKGRQCL